MMLRRMLLNLTILALVSGALSAPLAADNEPLVVDLLPKRVEVDSSFTGSTVILFGVKTQPGDIIVTLRGPEAPVLVRRKRRVAGIWVNRDSVAFRDVPQYYSMAASRPIDEISVSKSSCQSQYGSPSTGISHPSRHVSTYGQTKDQRDDSIHHRGTDNPREQIDLQGKRVCVPINVQNVSGRKC